MSGPVVLTASEDALAGLEHELGDLPLVRWPLLVCTPPESWDELDAAIERLDRYGAATLTSPRAAAAFRVRLDATGRLVPPEFPIWTAGEATAAALGPVGVRPVVAPAAGGAGTAVAEAILAARVASPILFPCGDRRRDELPRLLRAAGYQVDEIVCYHSELATAAEARAAVDGAMAVVVASPSVAALLAEAIEPERRPPLISVGPTTAAAARDAGWTPAAVASDPEPRAVAAAVRVALPRT